jgi:hypothetical protein
MATCLSGWALTAAGRSTPTGTCCLLPRQPIHFTDPKQAARWILDTGYKQSPSQLFELANHPTQTGAVTIRQRAHRSRGNR